METNNVGKTIIRLPQKIKEYAQPRPETQGDLEASSPVSAAIGGAVEGLIVGGPMTAVAGGIGGYTGVKMGEKKGSFLAAIGTGGVTGAVIGGLTVAGLAAIMGMPITLSSVAGSCIIGGLSGVAGTLSGSRKTSTRDGVYGGYITGMMAGAATGNPAMMIAGAAAGGIGGKAVKPLGRVILGGLAGMFTGALTGVFGGPMGIVIGAVTGTVVGSVGAVVGPPIRQVMRNATEDIANAASNFITPRISGKIGKTGKVALGAVAGALPMAFFGLILGPYVGGLLAGVGILGAVGAATGAVSTYKYLKSIERQRQAEAPEVQLWQPKSPQVAESKVPISQTTP